MRTYWIAGVVVGGHAVLFVLEAEKWASRGLVRTPDLLRWEVDGLWVNPVDAVCLGLDGDGEGEGGSASELEAVHLVYELWYTKASVRTSKL